VSPKAALRIAPAETQTDPGDSLRVIKDNLPTTIAVEPLLTPADFAGVLRVSMATFWRLRSAGKLPRPLTTLGAQILRWRAAEVRDWISAGMPTLKQWEAIKTA
jgi:predicted DNA-binding transcriptional regulator AlpA